MTPSDSQKYSIKDIGYQILVIVLGQIVIWLLSSILVSPLLSLILPVSVFVGSFILLVLFALRNRKWYAFVLPIIYIVASVVLWPTVMSNKPWCDKYFSLIQMEVIHQQKDGSQESTQHLSPGYVTVGPEEPLVVRVKPFIENTSNIEPECRWTILGDAQKVKEQNCVLHLKSGKDTKDDVISLSVSQSFCGAVSSNLFLKYGSIKEGS